MRVNGLVLLFTLLISGASAVPAGVAGSTACSRPWDTTDDYCRYCSCGDAECAETCEKCDR